MAWAMSEEVKLQDMMYPFMGVAARYCLPSYPNQLRHTRDTLGVCYETPLACLSPPCSNDLQSLDKN